MSSLFIRMNWTNEKPTAAGWYWYRDLKMRSEIVRVEQREGDWVVVMEEADSLYCQFQDGDWAGPIPLPTEHPMDLLARLLKEAGCTVDPAAVRHAKMHYDDPLSE